MLKDSIESLFSYACMARLSEYIWLMTTLKRQETLDQLLIHIEHPELATATGRVLDEVKRTATALAHNRNPRTTLGGLLVTGRFMPDATAEGRTIAAIAAAAHISPVETDHRGDTMNDVLVDLVELGIVEVANPQSPIDALIEGEERPRFRIVSSAEL